MKATEQLKAEHEGVKLMLRILSAICKGLESGGNVNPNELDKVIEFFKIFVDKCHHGKEEDLLFPAMERAGIPREGGPLGQMLFEHEQGRDHVRAMAAAVSAYRNGDRTTIEEFVRSARRYATLLTEHIEKENMVLFPMADSCLSAEEQEAKFAEFEKLEAEKIGPGVHEEFHKLLDRLAGAHLQDNDS